MANVRSTDILAEVAAERASGSVRNDKLIKPLVLFSLGLTFLLAYFYFPWLSGHASFYKSDVTYYFEPFTSFMADSYRAGRLPMWNPYIYNGMPQIAVPSPSMFYPPIALFVAMPFSKALGWFMLVHQLAAGVGAFLLVASLGWGVAAALVCGAAVGLCGYMFALTSNYTLVAAVAWLPLLLYGLRTINGAWTRANVLRTIGTALAMFMLVAAGRPEVSVPAACIAAAYVVVAAAHSYLEDKVLRPNLLIAAFRMIALVGGGMLAAPILLPAMEWVKLSPRQNGLELQWVLMWSANWYDCLCLVLAQPMGDVTILGSKYLDVVASRPRAIPFLVSSYVGPVVATMAIWGMCDKNWRWRWLVLAVFAGTLLMALGGYTPVAPFICKLSPVLAAFRYPVKLMIFPALALCFAAGRGTFIASEMLVGSKTQIFSALFWSVIGIVGALLLLCPEVFAFTQQYFWQRPDTTSVAFIREVHQHFGRSLCFAAGIAGLVHATYIFYRTLKFDRLIFAAGLLVLLIPTMLSPAVSYCRTGGTSDYFSRPVPLANELKKLIGQREANQTQPSTAAPSPVAPSPVAPSPVAAVSALSPATSDSSAVSGPRFKTRAQALLFDPLTPGQTFMPEHKVEFQVGFYLFTRQILLQNTNVSQKVPYAFGYEAGEVGSFKTFFTKALGMSSQNRAHSKKAYLSDAPMARFLQMTSVSTVTTQAFHDTVNTPVAALDPRYFLLLKSDLDLNLRIYKAKQTNPRAYFADENQIAWNTTLPQFTQTLLDDKATTLFEKTYVEVGRDGLGLKPAGPVATASSGSPSQSDLAIEFIRDEDDRISLSVDTAAEKLLVTTEQYYPGWICRIDGKETKIHRVNFFARGVLVPVGKHTVDFKYQPTSLRNGFYISVAVLVFFLLALVLAGTRSRSRVPDTMSRKWSS